MAAEYGAACAEAGTQPLPAVLDYLSGPSREVNIAGNSTPIRQLVPRRLEDKDIVLAAQHIAASGQPLRTFNVGYNRLTDEGATAVATALSGVNVGTLNVQDNDSLGAAGAEALLSKVACRTIVLDGNKIGDKGARAAAALVGNPAALLSLQHLSLARCDVGIDGLIALTSAVPSSTALLSLDVSELRLTSRNEEVAFHVGDMLKASTSLTVLGLRKTPHLTHTGLQAIVEGIMANTGPSPLTTLDLTACKLGPPAGLLLASALSRGLSLSALHLSHCALGDEGAVALARVLATGQCPVGEVDLRSNGIGDEGIVALAQAMDSPDCRVQRLRVWGNPGLELVPGGRPGIEAMAAWQGAGQPGVETDFHTYYVDGTAHVAEA